MIIIFSILISFLSLSKKGLLWLVLPVSIFWDLWKGTVWGLSGLKISVIILLMFFIFSSRMALRNKYRWE